MIPRHLSFVRFDYSDYEENKSYFEHFLKVFPNNAEARFLFLGECPQAPGHCFIWDLKEEKLLGLYHTDNFVELTEEEL